MSVRMHHIDAMNFMKNVPDKWYNLAVVDTNWGIGESSKNHNSRNTPIKQKNGAILKAPDKNYKQKNWDDKPPSQEYWDELFRISEYQIIWGINHLNFTQKSTSSGRIFWDKVNMGNDFSDGELAWTNLFSSIRQVEILWNGHMQAKSLLEGRTQQGNKKLNQKRIHQTEKPFLLYQWIFKNYYKPGWKVIDTHMGSGSICVVADRMGIDLDACEIDIDHYTDAVNRFNQLTSKDLFNA